MLDTETKLQVSKINWPRDGAMIQGEVLMLGKNKWLRPKKLKQKNEDWIDAPSGAFLPFEYDEHYYLEKTFDL